MLYADGLNAIIIMGGIFAVGVFNLEIKDLLKLSILMNVAAFVGAFVGGIANDKYGSKAVIIFSLIGLIKEESQNIRAIALLVSIWFLIFSIPFLFFEIKENKKKIKKGFSSNFSDLKKLLWMKKISTLG